MKIHRPVLSALLLLPLLAGCTLKTSGPDLRTPPVPGTPYTAVLARLGNPVHADFAPDGSCEAVWMGSRTRGGTFSVGYIGISFRLGHTRTAAGGCRMTFGPDGTLTTAVPVGSRNAVWRAWPFGS